MQKLGCTLFFNGYLMLHMHDRAHGREGLEMQLEIMKFRQRFESIRAERRVEVVKTTQDLQTPRFVKPKGLGGKTSRRG